MVFSSLSFLYFFLPCTVLLYFAVPPIVYAIKALVRSGFNFKLLADSMKCCKADSACRCEGMPGTTFTIKWHNGVLLCASLIFYAWGEPKLVLMMLLSAIIAYFGGLGMDCFRPVTKTYQAAQKEFEITFEPSSLTVSEFLHLLGQSVRRTLGICNSEKQDPGPANTLSAASAEYSVGNVHKEITRQQVYVTTVVLLVANLFIFKYFNFAVSNFAKLLGTTPNIAQIVLPIGISFYTFQILSYVIDLKRGEIEVQKSFPRLLLYVCLFPQLIAGPIVRYQTVERELSERCESIDAAFGGTLRFIAGLGKKVLLANNLAIIAETIYAGDTALFGSGAYWLAGLAYSLQIYFDFSGYSDMAIGIGLIFGFHFEENFERPYLAGSVTEFWRRWHISLSGWFRDYVYIPLGGNRVGAVRRIVNILIVWGLTGLWHGAEWNFVLWGLYYGVLLIAEKTIGGWLQGRKAAAAEDRGVGKRTGGATAAIGNFLQSDAGKVFRWMVTMFIVLIGWVFFNRNGLDQPGQTLGMMFSSAPTRWLDAFRAHTELLYGFIWLPASLLTVALEKGGWRRAWNGLCALCRCGADKLAGNYISKLTGQAVCVSTQAAQNASSSQTGNEGSPQASGRSPQVELNPGQAAIIDSGNKNNTKELIADVLAIIWFAAVLVLCLMQLLNSSYNPFIYFRF